jgi:hypothetical protein|tara:strand:- start:2132 stop:2518 length:387 start_codon:yes stop_codon:yes gene_type:complete
MSAPKKTCPRCKRDVSDLQSISASVETKPVIPPEADNDDPLLTQPSNAPIGEDVRLKVGFGTTEDAKAHREVRRQWAAKEKATRYQDVRLVPLRWLLIQVAEFRALKRLVKESVFVGVQYAKHQWKQR